MIALPTILLLFSIILHICISRTSFIVISQQILIIKISIILNVIILINYFITNDVNLLMFQIISYNCLIYSYFHFFNLSDTGRRIKILLMIHDNKDIKNYSSSVMIDNRIARLQKFGWIRKKRSKYVISKKYPLFILKILRVLKKFS